MCFVCSLAKQRTVFKLQDGISGFSVSQGSAEPLYTRGEKTKHHLISYFLSTRVTLLPKIVVMGSCRPCQDYSKSKVGRF